jgi:hypothetical protein
MAPKSEIATTSSQLTDSELYKFAIADTQPAAQETVRSNSKKERGREPEPSSDGKVKSREKPENETEPQTEAQLRIETWKNAVFVSSLKAAELDTSGLTREEIKEVGRRLFFAAPFVFESAYTIHDFWLSDKDLNEMAKTWLTTDSESALWIFQTLQLSNKQIKQVLAEFPNDRQRKILREMNIPGVDGEEQLEGLSLEAYKLKRDQSTERDPITIKRRERMMRTQKISFKLGRAIVEAFPERSALEQHRLEIEQQLLTAKFKRLQSIGRGATAPTAAILEGRELPAVLKLFSAEPGFNDDPKKALRSGIAPGASTPREWLAYQLSRVLAPDLVPVTVFRESPIGDGILQEWEVGITLEQIRFISQAQRDQNLRKQLLRNGTFDQVVNNSDRHPGNKQLTTRNTIKDIDNGLIFPVPVNKYDSLRSCSSWAVGGEKIDNDIIEPYERFLRACLVEQRVREYTTKKLEKEAAIADKPFKKIMAYLKGVLGIKSPDEGQPTESELKQAKLVEIIRTCFNVALGNKGGQRAFKEMLDNIQKLIEQRIIQNSSPTWHTFDERTSQFYREEEDN